MLYKCVANVWNTAIRFNLNTFNGFKPIRITEFHHTKNVYQFSRQFNSQNGRSKASPKTKADNSAESIAYYSMAVVILCGGLSFAAVPLYRLFCQVWFWDNFVFVFVFVCWPFFLTEIAIRIIRRQGMAAQSMKIMMLAKWRIWNGLEIEWSKFNLMLIRLHRCDGILSPNNMN